MRVFVSGMLHYLRMQHLITEEQRCFVNRASTVLSLPDTLNEWALDLNNRFSATVVYIDYDKAFNIESLIKLCHKLKISNISGKLCKLYADSR